jgi:hypothetical protein
VSTVVLEEEMEESEAVTLDVALKRQTVWAWFALPRRGA